MAFLVDDAGVVCSWSAGRLLLCSIWEETAEEIPEGFKLREDGVLDDTWEASGELVTALRMVEDALGETKLGGGSCTSVEVNCTPLALGRIAELCEARPEEDTRELAAVTDD